VSAAGFALAWWVCQELIRLDEGISLGIAGALLAVLLAVGSWWAPRGAEGGEADDTMREQAGPVRQKAGDAENTISGGTFIGPVLQGRDFIGLTFGASPVSPASQPEDPDVAG
jgi:hypothetical protein